MAKKMGTYGKLEYYVKAFSKLNVNRAGDHPSPHKPVMLLAVLELAEAGLLTENKICYNQELLERFRSFFQAVQKTGDACNPYFPFFHMYKGEPFWHLKPLPGKDATIEAMSTVRGPSAITANIVHAFLDDELFAMIHREEERLVLRQALIDAWFPKDGEVIKTVAAEERQIVTYENELKRRVEHKAAESPDESYDEKARSAAFSRLVRVAYDYRCAASGCRVILPDGSVMVEAAHLIPFSESKDNDPRNGIALAPNFHWALDKYILAPGPDLKWHVSSMLDKRNRDYQELIELDKKPLLLPANKKYYPRMDALEWRIGHLAG